MTTPRVLVGLGFTSPANLGNVVGGGDFQLATGSMKAPDEGRGAAKKAWHFRAKKRATALPDFSTPARTEQKGAAARTEGGCEFGIPSKRGADYDAGGTTKGVCTEKLRGLR